MNQFKSLKKNQEFQSVYQGGKSRANRVFAMIIKKNDLCSNRIGISVSKKVGNSVIRHRVTRIVREIMRLHWEEVEQGFDIVIVARRSARESDYNTFESAIFHLLKLHHILKDDDLE
ncbi:MAG: ribonuclease P protein component [Eubacterium sp.]|nr:ribonuclease P protein component [Eubacterium sp.]MDY5496694.1 ribonuclease P protein component [Anaerobutyricum sp.]